MDPLPAAQSQPRAHVEEPRRGSPGVARRAGGGARPARPAARDGQVLRRRPQRTQELEAVAPADREAGRGGGELGRRGMGTGQQADQQASPGDGARNCSAVPRRPRRDWSGVASPGAGMRRARRGEGRGARAAGAGSPVVPRPAVECSGGFCHGLPGGTGRVRGPRRPRIGARPVHGGYRHFRFPAAGRGVEPGVPCPGCRGSGRASPGGALMTARRSERSNP